MLSKTLILAKYGDIVLITSNNPRYSEEETCLVSGLALKPPTARMECQSIPKKNAPFLQWSFILMGGCLQYRNKPTSNNLWNHYNLSQCSHFSAPAVCPPQPFQHEETLKHLYINVSLPKREKMPQVAEAIFAMLPNPNIASLCHCFLNRFKRGVQKNLWKAASNCLGCVPKLKTISFNYFSGWDLFAPTARCNLVAPAHLLIWNWAGNTCSDLIWWR